jgi:hypothetical protein
LYESVLQSDTNVGTGTIDRDRGAPHDAAPPTPPYVRVRIRRFERFD